MSSTTKMEGIDLAPEQNGWRVVSRQLHQTTQPLSILQGVLELALVQVRNEVVMAVHDRGDDVDEARGGNNFGRLFLLPGRICALRGLRLCARGRRRGRDLLRTSRVC